MLNVNLERLFQLVFVATTWLDVLDDFVKSLPGLVVGLPALFIALRVQKTIRAGNRRSQRILRKAATIENDLKVNNDMTQVIADTGAKAADVNEIKTKVEETHAAAGVIAENSEQVKDVSARVKNVQNLLEQLQVSDAPSD
jgi:hypothetical protein